MEGTGSSAIVRYTHTDHLTGSALITDAAGAQLQLLDYHPWGTQRINEQSGDYDAKRKFAWEWGQVFTFYFMYLQEKVKGKDLTPKGDEKISYEGRSLKHMHEICGKMNVECKMPDHDQLVAISDGVYEGEAVQGVRYSMEPHMSGWIITTNQYDGNVGTLRTEHIKHLMDRRKDLLQYLCLPVGWRFDTERNDVWLDEKVRSPT